MTRVPVSSAVLHWAINRSGRPDEIRQKFLNLPKWLQGEGLPTLRQIEQLARATSTPLGYFFLAEPPEERLPVPHFRTLAGTPTSSPSPDLLETVQTMEQRQAWMRENLIEQGQEVLPFVRSARLEDEPWRIAQGIRQALGLTERWAAGQRTWTEALRELQRKIEDARILVVVSGIVGNNTRRKLDPGEFRGFVLVDEYVPLLFINGSDGKAAQMFTLAHELAHIWFGSSAAFDLRELQPAQDATEQACNRVAAELLVPEEELKSFWASVKDESEPFQAIARQCKVSVLVAARRTLDLGLITKREFLEFYQAYQEDERRVAVQGQKGGNFYATQNLRIGRRFAVAVVHAAREGKLLYREAYQLTGLYGKSFERYAQSLGFEGPV